MNTFRTQYVLRDIFYLMDFKRGTSGALESRW
jgi:hypothetical protein